MSKGKPKLMSETAQNQNEPEQTVSEVMRVRREKLDSLSELGVEPYPHKYDKTHSAREVLDRKDDLLETTVALAGRLMAIRGHGKVFFGHIMDSTARIQIYVRKDEMKPIRPPKIMIDLINKVKNNI